MTEQPRRAFLFSGQGAQKIGMGVDLREHSPAARALYHQADQQLGWSLSQICQEGPEAILTETRVCQPALYVHGLALLATAQELVKQPLRFAACAGLSLGEYTAHAAAGTFSFETGLSLVFHRGKLMQEACASTQGAMMILLGATENQAREIAQACDVDIANLNCPGQIVLSGEKNKIESIPPLAKEKGLRKAISLNVAGAYHSRLMASAMVALEPYLAQAEMHAPKVPVISNYNVEAPTSAERIRADLLAQVCGSVRWEASLRHLISEGITEFLEFGPGAVLAGMVKRIDPNIRCLSLETYADLVQHSDVLL